MKWEIFKKFSAENKSFFSYSEVCAEYPDKDRSYLSKVLAAMVRAGMLLKIHRNVYLLVPLNADHKTYSPDSRLIAKSIMSGREYYIAYSSAMHILGLTDQPGSKMVIVSNQQIQPAIKVIAGKEIQFVCHALCRFFGYREMWVANREQAMVSDLEKTIVDAASKPQLCGGITAVGNAIYQSKERVELEKLFYYFVRNGSHAAKKRYLFLSNLLGMGWSSEHERLLNHSGASISLLDPSVPDQGSKNSRFGLKINVEENRLIDSIKTQWNP